MLAKIAAALENHLNSTTSRQTILMNSEFFIFFAYKLSALFQEETALTVKYPEPGTLQWLEMPLIITDVNIYIAPLK